MPSFYTSANARAWVRSLCLVGAAVGFNVGGAIGNDEAQSIEFGLVGSVVGCGAGVVLAILLARRILRSR